MSAEYSGYADYWDAYLRAHSRPATRACHYAATAVGLGGGLWSLLALTWPPVVIGIACGYAIAITSHFLIEGNRPLTHRPLWGAVSDLRMIGLALTGRLGAELQRVRG